MPAKIIRAILLVGTVWVLGIGFLESRLSHAQDSMPQGSTYVAQTVMTLPQTAPGAPPSAGANFNAKVSIPTDQLPGYIPATLEMVSTIGAMPTRRNLSLRITPVGIHFPATNALIAEFSVPFPEGQRRVSYDCTFPKWTLGYNYRVQIFEDGEALSDYTGELAFRNTRIDQRTGVSYLMDSRAGNIAFVGDYPPLSGLQELLEPRVASELRNQQGIWSHLDLADLPRDWRLMRGMDVIILDDSDLQSGAFKQATVLQEWLMMGGVLVVQNSAPRDQLENQLGLKLVEPKKKSPSFSEHLTAASARIEQYQQIASEWIERVETVYQTNEAGSTSIKNVPSPDYANRAVPLPTRGELDELIAEQEALQEKVDEFGQRWNNAIHYRVAGGSVIAFPGQELSWAPDLVVLNQFRGLLRSPAVQRGVDPMLGDQRFNRWLIPGVAQPPVYSFIGLLTLFVILVGPLSYTWTSRSGRSHLMFVIAPLLALLTTLALFTYSVVSDGFGVKARVRQITWVDATTGTAVERTRTTLFAGASPKSGLKFPASAEVLPYPNQGLGDWHQLPQEVEAVRLVANLDDDQQAFNRYLLPARTQRQFVTHDTRHGLGSIQLGSLPAKPAAANSNPSNRSQTRQRDTSPFEFDPGSTDLVKVTVTSSLPFELRRIVIRSADGRYWVVKTLDSEQPSEAIWLQDETRASAALGELYNLYRPIGDSFTQRTSRGNRVVDLLVATCRQINRGKPPMTEGLFEDQLNTMLSVTGEIPPGTFVGLANPSRDAVPIAEAEVVQSVRYVWGTINE